jgi:hypothetical protein
LEQSRTELFANKESELIDRALRDAKVKEIGDDDLRNSLEHEIESLRRERDRLSREAESPTYERIEFDLLAAAAKSEGSITKRQHLGGRSIHAGTMKFGHTSAEDYAIAEHGINLLMRKGLLKRQGSSSYELTADGWNIAKEVASLRDTLS